MSYYSLPSIKCNERKNTMSNVFSSSKDKCLNLNPNIFIIVYIRILMNL